MNRRFMLLPFAAAALVLTFITPGSAGADVPRRSIVFGCPIALTGQLQNEGRMTREGYDLWARYVNAHGGLRVGAVSYPVEIRYIDDKSDPDATARAAEQLISGEHVDFLLGPYGSAQTFTAAAVAEGHAVPMISSSGSAERIYTQGYRFTFGVQAPARKYFAGIIEFAVGRT